MNTVLINPVIGTKNHQANPCEMYSVPAYKHVKLIQNQNTAQHTNNNITMISTLKTL